MFFQLPGSTSTRAFTLRRASASLTSGMARTHIRKFSSNNSVVRTVPLDGLMAAKLIASPSDRMERALRIMPTAKRPTAIDNTISTVRVLLPSKSWMTLYQRALSMVITPAGDGGFSHTDDLAIRERDQARAAGSDV